MLVIQPSADSDQHLVASRGYSRAVSRRFEVECHTTKTGHGRSCNQPQSNPFRRRLKIRVSSDRRPEDLSVVGDDRAGNLHREWASTVLLGVQITVSVSSPRGITRDWGDIIISFHLTSP